MAEEGGPFDDSHIGNIGRREEYKDQFSALPWGKEEEGEGGGYTITERSREGRPVKKGFCFLTLAAAPIILIT